MTRNYYCNNCYSIVGKWKNKINNYSTWKYTLLSPKGSYDSIKNLSCKKCNTIVGLYFLNVCIDCFGENQIFETYDIESFLEKFKPTILKNSIEIYSKDLVCLICKSKNHKSQCWFYDNITIQKK